MKRNSTITSLLLEKGATLAVDHRNLANKLCEAGSDGDCTFLELLIASEANINLQNVDGRTVGHLAACEGKVEVLELLIDTGKKP
jgi:ankyrin repeat protein